MDILGKFCMNQLNKNRVHRVHGTLKEAAVFIAVNTDSFVNNFVYTKQPCTKLSLTATAFLKFSAEHHVATE